MPAAKGQRIRDPVHNLIEFGTDQFEQVLWRVIQTAPFQRLRHIRQLGFSEFVYPGATHTRFAHSIGAFHTARRLVSIIERHLHKERGQREYQALVALAASLVHDLGHGMFSHAFESVGNRLGLKLADHQLISDQLIRHGEVREVLRELGSGFADDVATVVGSGPGNLYDAVVSSQFDADRLDYMQRDRLMTGVKNSGIDHTWLMANIEVGKVRSGVDAEAVGEVDTFVLGPKASHEAEQYVLALFHLYPTVYLHKATRAAEKLFTALMVRIISLCRDGHSEKNGLSDKHPFVRFAASPESVDNILSLDDAVFWGALPMLVEASDPTVSRCASRLQRRSLPKCIDVREIVVERIGSTRSMPLDAREEHKKKIGRLTVLIEERLNSWSREQSSAVPRILTDRATRTPYRKLQESKGPLNQVRIRIAGDKILDLAESSAVVAAIEPFELFRVYVDGDDDQARAAVDAAISDELGRPHNAR